MSGIRLRAPSDIGRQRMSPWVHNESEPQTSPPRPRIVGWQQTESKKIGQEPDLTVWLTRTRTELLMSTVLLRCSPTSRNVLELLDSIPFHPGAELHLPFLVGGAMDLKWANKLAEFLPKDEFRLEIPNDDHRSPPEQEQGQEMCAHRVSITRTSGNSRTNCNIATTPSKPPKPLSPKSPHQI